MCRQMLAALLGAALAAPSAASGADLEAELRAIVGEELARSGVPAISVALVKDGELAAAVAGGLADVESKRDATPDTVFGAASVSKLMTATLAMRAVERGALELDQPANRYLPEERWIRDASGAPVAATLRNLLTHTSGIPVSWEAIQFEPGDGTPDLDAYLAHGLRTIRPPGEKIIYANDAYALLGYLAAQAAGRDFAELAKDELFAPLGMTSTSFRRVPELAARSARGYGGMLGLGTSAVSAPFQTNVNPAGSLVTTPSDLTRFARMVLGHGELDGVRILRAETLEEMQRLQARQSPLQNEGYGLGFLVRERDGRKQVWHDGDLPGVAARLAILPELGAAVAVIANRDDHEPVNLVARRALALVAGAEEPAAAAPDVAALSAVEGTYRAVNMMPPRFWYLELLFNLELSARDGRLVAHLPIVGGDMELEPVGGGAFRILGGMIDDSTLVFAPDALYASFVEMHRIPWWQRARALVAYAGTVVIAAVGALVWLAVRLLRRRRLA